MQAGDSDLKRQQALAEICKEGPLPDTMRDLLAPFLAAGGVDGAAGPDAEPPAAGEPAPAAATFAQSALPQAEVEEASAPAAAQVLLSPLNSSAHYPSSPFFLSEFPYAPKSPFSVVLALFFCFFHALLLFAPGSLANQGREFPYTGGQWAVCEGL